MDDLAALEEWIRIRAANTQQTDGRLPDGALFELLHADLGPTD